MLVKKHVMTIQILGMYIVQASRNLEYLLDINNNKIAISKITHISISFHFEFGFFVFWKGNLALIFVYGVSFLAPLQISIYLSYLKLSKKRKGLASMKLRTMCMGRGLVFWLLLKLFDISPDKLYPHREEAVEGRHRGKAGKWRWEEW